MNRKAIVMTSTAVGLSVLMGGLFGINLPSLAHAQGNAGMGSQQSATNTTATTAPNTITVTGVSGMEVSNVITSLQFNYTITDSTAGAVMKDGSNLISRLKQEMHRLGMKPTAYQLNLNSVNIGNQMPNASVMLNFNAATPNAEYHYFSAINSMVMPTYVSGVFSNTQTAPADPSVVRAKLFTAALADAKTQATMLAQAVGEQLGSVISMNANPQNYQIPNYNQPNQSYIGGLAENYSGNSEMLDMNSQISVTYALLSS